MVCLLYMTKSIFAVDRVHEWWYSWPNSHYAIKKTVVRDDSTRLIAASSSSLTGETNGGKWLLRVVKWSGRLCFQLGQLTTEQKVETTTIVLNWLWWWWSFDDDNSACRHCYEHIWRRFFFFLFLFFFFLWQWNSPTQWLQSETAALTSLSGNFCCLKLLFWI